jgi:hypothetical protein
MLCRWWSAIVAYISDRVNLPELGLERTNLQCACSENRDDRSLLLSVHLQVPYKEDRKNRESPVRDTRDRRIAVERCDDDLGIHARTFGVRVGDSFPEVRGTIRIVLVQSVHPQVCVQLTGNTEIER